MRPQFKAFIPLSVGIAALFIPLIRDFHIESAMIAAVAGAFWGGIASSISSYRKDFRHALTILGYLYLAGFPLLVYALISGCFTIDGVGFWLFIPAPSVFFGYGIGRLARKFGIKYPASVTALVLIIIAIIYPAIEFFNLSQLYLFNHVWGVWPGPIYDEAIKLSGSIIAYRFITLCWILILWAIPHLKEEIIYRWIIGLSSVALIFCYIQLEQMGIISPEEHLQQKLGGFHETENVRIYFAGDYFSNEEINRLGKKFEFYIHDIKNTLGIDKPDSAHKIETYLYAHVWQKKRLVGAKYTSYVTVWKETPQIHIAKQQIDGSLKHEVVHAVTALMDEPGLLPNIGLTEGVAVALNPDRSSHSTIDQLVAAQKPYPGAEDMESALSYWGFYTGRSAVSYTTTGSFVRYLLDRYPSEYFVDAYESGSLEGIYPGSFQELVAGWHQKLDSVAVDTADRRRASEIFGRLSIFEQHCPHKVSKEAELFDRFLLSQAEKDTSRAIALLSELKVLKSRDPLPQLLWLFWNLQAGNIDKVARQANLADTLVDAQLFYADAFQLKNRSGIANKHLYRAIELAAHNKDTTHDEPLAIRLDSVQWSYDLTIRYDNGLLDPAAFKNAYYLTKIRTIHNAIEKYNPVLLNEYAVLLHDQPVSFTYIDTYLAIIHQLAFYHFYDKAEVWIRKLANQNLNLRFQERLQLEKEWVDYLK